MEADVVVLGGGAAGMAAAALAAAEGLRVILLEKTGQLGGTTATSGGMVWAPGNAKAAAIGLPDSVEAARRYLGQTVPGTHNAAARAAFLAHAAAAIDALEARTELRFMPVASYPDYYPDREGAALGGRVLEPVPFDGAKLGRHFALLRPPLPEFMVFGGMMIGRADLVHFRNFARSFRSAARVARLLGAYGRQRLTHSRGTTLVLGNALAGRLFSSLLRLGVDVRLNHAAERLVMEDGRVSGVRVRGETIRARRGVVLATGGFSHDPALRAELLPKAARFSAAHSGNSGDGIRLARAAGGAQDTSGEDSAFWTPVSRFIRRDGSEAIFPHTVTDRGKPGTIAVNAAGQRFVNEALSYHEFVRAMLRDEAARRATFLLCDHRFLRRYGLGPIPPFPFSPKPWQRSGYLVSAPDLAALARALGLNAAALEGTVSRFNDDARAGIDRAFGRGSDAYQRYLGDPLHRPNPCLAPLATPPFHAIALYAADLGTAAGLAADQDARVLNPAGQPIPGLYACGNDMHSVMNGAYPGPGITLGPALTFAYLAVRSLSSASG
jgi:succinate dehydrogenase/fumarate reductase flavoprotein subunit